MLGAALADQLPGGHLFIHVIAPFALHEQIVATRAALATALAHVWDPIASGRIDVVLPRILCLLTSVIFVFHLLEPMQAFVDLDIHCLKKLMIVVDGLEKIIQFMRVLPNRRRRRRSFCHHDDRAGASTPGHRG